MLHKGQVAFTFRVTSNQALDPSTTNIFYRKLNNKIKKLPHTLTVEQRKIAMARTDQSSNEKRGTKENPKETEAKIETLIMDQINNNYPVR